MKKLLIILSVFSFFIIKAQTPQITNGDFENWTLKHLFSLQDYQDAADEGKTENTIRSTDAKTGQYSVKLVTTQDNGNSDLNVGFFINFDPDHDFKGGTPYNEHVDSICGYYKAQVMPQDTALLLVNFKKIGNIIGGDIYKFPADKNTTDWKRFCYKTNMPAGITPDSLMIGAASSNAIDENGMTAGSWIQFDSIFFKTNNQLATPPPNSSFENWDEKQVYYPDNFHSSLEWDITTSPLSVERSNDASHGNYAVKLNTVVNQQQDTIVGLITNGMVADWPFPGGIATNETPNEVSWDYKVNYAGFATFNPSINLILKKQGQQIANYGNSYSQTFTTYQHEDIMINSTQTPDTLQFVASSGDYPGNSLKVDHIILYFPAGNINHLNIQQAVAYPIPAKNKLNFKITATKTQTLLLEIINLTGQILDKKIYIVNQGNNRIVMGINHLPAGPYLYRFTTSEGSLTRQFIKQ